MRAAVDRIGADLLSAGNLRDSLRELLREGLDGRGGLDRLADRIRRLREQARRRGDLGGTLDQVRAALDQALAAERETLAASDGDDARFAEMELDTLPDDVAGAVRALEPYGGGPRRPARPTRRSSTCSAARCWTPSSPG